MEFINDFEKREWLGREALKELKKVFPSFWKYDIQFTEYQYEYYDAFFLVYDSNTHKLLKRVFIEIKIRDKEYDDYVLEKKKVGDIRKKLTDILGSLNDTMILYINFCPNGTYLWDITNIEPNDCTEDMYMNKATSISRSNKVKKKCKLLKRNEAKTFDYIYNENQIMINYKQNYLLPKVEESIKKNGLSKFFDSLGK